MGGAEALSRRSGPAAAVTIAAGGAAVGLGLLAVRDPVLAILAGLAIAFVAVTVWDLGLGLLLFTTVSFLEVLPGLGDVSAAKLAGGVLALAWIAVLATDGGGRRHLVTDHPWFTATVALFVAWTAASAIWAEDPGAARYTTMRYALNIMLVFIAYTALRRRGHAMWFVAVFVLGALLSAAWGFVVQGGPAAEASGRLAGAGVDPNDLAITLASGMALAFAVAFTRGIPGVARAAAAVATPICGVALLATNSRTGLVALAMAMVLGVLVAGPRRRLPLLVTTATAVTLTVLYFAALASREAVERVTTPGGGTGRADIWTVGWRMVEAEPAKGVGAGNFPVTSVHYLLEPGAILRDDFIVDHPKVAHNVYLETLAELGVPGLLMLLAIFGFPLVCGLRAARAFAAQGDLRMELLARGSVVASGAVLAGAFFVSVQHFKPVWLTLALPPALLATARGR